MWLLDRDGLSPVAEVVGVEVAAETALGDLPEMTADTPLVLRFGATADGRGFSTARQLRARNHRGRITAAGPLVPDQARHAFQSGFDAVLISDNALHRQGEAAWREALVRAPSTLYNADSTSRAGETSVWALRHAR